MMYTSALRENAAVLLDVDGTLVDSNDAHARAWVEAFEEAGIRVEYERVRRAIGMGGDKLVPHVAGISEDSPEGARISRRRGEIFKSRYLPSIRPFPRVRELVERFIADGFTVVVASSAKDDELAALLERANVADLIEAQTSSDDADRSKPDPDIVEAAIGRSKAPREATVMFGDTPYDVQAALRAGIAIAGLESGGWRREDLAGAVEVYADPADLYERYDQSIFARVARERGVPGRSPSSIDMTLVMMIAAGVAGAVLIALMISAISRRFSESADADTIGHERAPLGPRDRERLRRLIARTS